jgi:SAM-dependent methyltransferase
VNPSAENIDATTRQKQDFLAGEGDQWFKRNRSALVAPSVVRDLTVQRIAAQLKGRPQCRLLEIGCGQGDNLEQLRAACPIEGHGIDPSSEAVATGLARYAGLQLRTGTADELPYEDASFDVVWFGFCLYLVDRPLLLRAVAEADRILRDNGLLVIVDFDPAAPCVRPYHHRAGLMTYKMDYARLFLANPAYVLAEKHSLSHQDHGWSPDPQERVSISLCRKDLAHAYQRL